MSNMLFETLLWLLLMASGASNGELRLQSGPPGVCIGDVDGIATAE